MRRGRSPLARKLALEQFEQRLVLSFFTSIGGCEPIAEHGRLLMQAAAIRTSDLSPGGEALAPAYQDAVVATMREELGDVDADSMATTLDRVRVHWNSTLTDTDVFGGIDIGSAEGQTFGYNVYLEASRPEVAYNRSLSDLILHEIVHSRQYESNSSSLSNFGYNYFKKWCQAGFSYENNALESDARGFVNAYGTAVYNALWPDTQRLVGGNNAGQNDGQPQEVTWELSGRIDEAFIELSKKNGAVWDRVHAVQQFLTANSLNDVSGSFNFDSQGQGSFRLSVSITTNEPHHSGTGSTPTTQVNNYSFSVGDDDLSGPKIVPGGVSGTISDSTPRLFTWQVSDNSGVSSSSATLIGPGGSLLNSAAASGTFDFTSYGPGSFTLQVTATDNDDDGGNDRATASKSRPVLVQDDDAEPPRIDFTVSAGVPLIGPGYSESHGLTNAVDWIATDPSGVDQVNLNLWRDATFLGTFQTAATDQLLLDGYGLGTFRIEVAARDADTDGWVGDQLTRIVTAYLTVTNAAPTVFAGGPYLMQEGRLLGLHAQGSDADPGDTEQLAYVWDLDNDGQFDDAVGADPVITWDQWVAAGVTDDGSYPLRVRVTDTFAATATANATITVLNAPPQVESIHSAPDIDESSELTVTGAFDDPSPADSHEVRIFWGDGTSSLATVNAIDRTFAAVHYYADDTPSGTAVDEYLLRVEVTDDDGATNPPTSRTLTVETNRVGGIELPSFNASLPTGVSGLLQSAQVFADPLPIATSAEAAQLFNHQHLINYPASGPFDLQATWTNTHSVAGKHDHSFDIPSSTQTFTGSSLGSYFQQSSDTSFALSTRSTETGSSGLPNNYTHEHNTGNVAFNTSTTFTYIPAPVYSTVISATFNCGTSSPFSLTGSARLFNFCPTSSTRLLQLTRNLFNQQGSMIVNGTGRKAVDFETSFQLWMGGPDGIGADGMSFGLGPLSSSSNFGEHGPSGAPGLWVAFDTFPNTSDATGLYIYYNGSQIHHTYVYRNDLRMNALVNVSASVTGDGLGNGQITVRHPSLPGGQRTASIPGWNPDPSWRFGFGARSGSGAKDFHEVENLTITGTDRPARTVTVSRQGTNQYILPRFDSSLGNLIQSVVTLDPVATNTTMTDGGQMLHDHDIGLEIPPFLFNVVNTPDAAATQTHSHSVDFAPIELDFTSDANLRSYFMQSANVVLAQPAIESTISLNHDHTIPAGTIPLRAVTTYTYDVSSSLVRVHNKNPHALSFNLPNSTVENSAVQLTGGFQDDGVGDTHQVLVNWGDGTSEVLSVPFGQYTFEGSHDYADDNPSATAADNYTVTVTVTDDDGGTAVLSRVITLLNALPVLSLALSATSNEGDLFALPAGAFVDRGQADSHIATILWGDSSSSAATVTQGAGAGLVSGSHVFLDEGSYPVVVTLRDDDGGESVQTMSVSVANVAPVIGRLWTEGPAVEGTGLTVRASVTDPGADVLTYTWDFGDGSAPASGINLNSIAHVFANEGTFLITMGVDDGDGGTTTRSLTVVVSDISTAASMSGAAEVVEGASYTLTLSAFTPAAASAIASWVVDWGDGSSNSYSSDGSVSHVYPDGPASRTVRVEVVKTVGGTSAIGTLPVSVLNAAPRITSLVGPGTGTEGAALQYVGSATDPGADALTYFWDFGDGSVGQSGIDLREVGHVFADDGAYQITLMVTDDDGESATRQIAVLVANAVPTITLDGATQTVEGSAYQLTLGVVADPGQDTVTEWIVNWGDGRTDTYAAGGIVTHAYPDGPGSHTIRVSLGDEDGVHRDLSQRSVTVANAAPVINSISGGAGVSEGQIMDLAALVADPAGPYDLLTYQWDFGDGSAIVQGVNLASARHLYSDDGDFTVTLQVTDEDGGSTVRTHAVTVANVIPLAVLSGPETATEGQPFGITIGSVFDSGSDVVTEWIVDWGDGQQQELADPSAASHVYADGPQAVEITLTLVDEDGSHADVARLPVAILNAPPVILLLTGDSSGTEGIALGFQSQATDVSVDAIRFDWDFGDGTTVASGIGLEEVSHTYADDGIYLVTLTVDDGDNGADAASMLVEVLNAVPTLLVTGPASVFEGQSIEFTLGAVTDSGADVVTNWLVDWGDDSNANYTSGGGVTHTFADGTANHTIRVTLIDEDGLFENAGLLNVEVVNRPPVIAELILPLGPREGDELEFSVAASDAAGESDTLVYTWDFGDGSAAVSGIGLTSVEHAYADDGTFAMHVTVADEDGGQDFREIPLVVSNVAPILLLAGIPTALEAVGYDLSLGAISDPGQDAVTHWLVDWGDGSQNSYSGGGVVSHVYPDGPVSRIITVSLVDEDGTHVAAQRPVLVSNTAPELTSVAGDSAGFESEELSFAAAANDPAGAADPLTYTWDFGDGSEAISGINLSAVAHVFVDDGDFAVKLVVTDGDGGAVSDFIAVQVENIAPDFEAGGAELLLPSVVGAFHRSGIQFLDPGADEWTGTVNYQDGTGDLALVIDQQTQRFNLGHVYVISGAFNVVVTVRDDDGGTHADAFQLEVILNTPPVANDDAVSTLEENAVVFNALSNDTDEQNNILLALTFVVTSPSRGLLTNHQDGTFTFDPNGDFESLAVGESDTVVFSYRIEDTFGETDTATVTITVDGMNDAPTVTRNNDSVTINEGQTATNLGSFADVDLSDSVTITTSIGAITQDVGNSGSWSWSFDTSDGPDENQTVTITADDGHGGIVTTSFQLIVENVNPIVTLTGSATANEGDTKTYHFSVSDPGADTFSVASQSCGANGLLSNAVFDSASGEGGFDCTFPDGPAASDVSVQVADSDNAPSNTAAIGMTIFNIDPEVLSLSLSSTSIDEGQWVTARGTFGDPALGVPTETFTGIALWSDGATTAVAITAGGFSTTRLFADDDPATGTLSDTFTVAITIADDDVGSDSETSSVLTVHNMAPMVGAITEPNDVSVGKLLTFSVPFSDVGTPDTHTCTANWGDGSSSAGAVSETNGSGSCTATHVYSGSGPLTVSFTVTDDDGGVGSQSLAMSVARSVFVLNPTLCGALTLSGNAQISVQGNVTVGSSCALNAIAASGNASITAAQVETVGGSRLTGNAIVSPMPVHITGPVDDPLASLVAPSSGPLLGQVTCSGNTVQPIEPGVYSRIQASGNCQLTMAPGVYIVAGGGFQISGNASVTGLEVTIYNAGSNFPELGGTTGSIQLSGNGNYDLTPPIDGPTSGVLIFQARDNTRGISLSGNSTGMLGTIYAPQAQLTLNGNGELQASLIVDNLRLSCNAASSLTAGSGPGNGDAAILAAGQLRTGVSWVSIQGDAGAMTSEQLARIRESIQITNAKFGPYGVTLVEVDAASQEVADIRLNVASTSPCGGQADGVLGCTAAEGEITLVHGWDWYAGADPSTIAQQQFDFQTIVTHELGHAIGLEHSSDTSSSMYARLETGVTRRDFTAHDMALLAETGGHDDHDHDSLVSALRAESGPSLALNHTLNLHDHDHDHDHGGDRQEGYQFSLPATVDHKLLVPTRAGVTTIGKPGDSFLAATTRHPDSGGASEEVLVGGEGEDVVLGQGGEDRLIGGIGGGHEIHESAADSLERTEVGLQDDALLELVTEWS